MNDQKITPLQGYNIGLIFLLRIWSVIAQKYSCASDPIHKLFFGVVCFEAESYEEWGEAIFRVLKKHRQLEGDLTHFIRDFFHIRKTEIGYEDELQFSEKELFLITIEFSKIYHERYGLELQYCVDHLESMQKHPQDYQEEWTIWSQVVLDVLEERKWICIPYFWNLRIHLGRFPEDTPENIQKIEALFATPDHIVGEVKRPFYERRVFLKTLSDGTQQWGFADEGEILDSGIQRLYGKIMLKWVVDPTHENGGCFAEVVSFD